MSTREELQLLAAKLAKLASTIQDNTEDLEVFVAKDVYYKEAIVAIVELVEQDLAKLTNINRVLKDLTEDI